MFKTSVYISNSKDSSEENILKLVDSKEISKKIEGMKLLIEYVSQGKIGDSILHTVVKEVLLMDNNELKRLLYYFLEIYVPFLKEGELLLLNNQIRKDLESPNEFIRGLTLRFVTCLNSKNVINNCYKSIINNTSHSVGYVRRNAYYCLGMIYKKIEMNDEIIKILNDGLYKEMDTFCLIQAFCSLWEINKEKAEQFAYKVKNTKSKDFSLILIEKIEDEKFLEEFVTSESSEVRLEACLKLLDLETNNLLLEKYVGIIFQDLKDNEDLFNISFTKLIKIKDTIDLSKYSLNALDLVNPFNIEISKLCLDFSLEVCQTKDAPQFYKLLILKYKEIEKMILKNKKMEILILENLYVFVSRFGIYNEEVKNICYKNINHEIPGLSFSCLNLLNSILENSLILENSKDLEILKILIFNIKNIKFGKIFRKIFKILVKYSGRKELEEIFSIVDGKFKEYCEFKGTSDFICFQKDSRFLISFLCISLTEMYFTINENNIFNGSTINENILNGSSYNGSDKNESDKYESDKYESFKNESDKNESFEDLKAKMIALFLSFTKIEDFCDESCKSTIFLCIKSLTLEISYKNFSKKKKNFLKRVDVLEPLEIPFFQNNKNEKIEKLKSFLESEDNDESLFNVVQLTGLSDPIYVEGTISYTKYEIILNILLINQTDNYLQTMLFDFGTSQNIRPVLLDLPDNMKARSAISKKLVFRVLDSSSGFINGSVTFKYPNENGEYANQNYTLNFREIKTDVSDFLEIKSCEIEDFKNIWRKMPWENVYSIKLMSSLSPRRVLEKFTKFVKGSIIDYKEEEDIIVSNIMCTTRQNDDIFYNVCIANNENFINLECRIRSNKEDIVKTMSNVLSRIVKEIRIK
ncbi:coatomer subunit beta (coPB) [Vairimorpha necatrix]|uniref:Coatomer subunit beta (CoPB) n=1 Tax=Vairimorpha necatrix TaxID=6039 RepID=A0AAX4JDA3_9MICR